MKPPSTNELVGPPPFCLDTEEVLKNFLGKSDEEMQRSFRNNPSMAGDFAYMAPGGLVYYLPAALSYLASSDSKGDWEFAHSLLCSLSISITGRCGPAVTTISEVAEFCDTNRAKYDIDTEDELFEGYLHTIRKYASMERR